MHQRYAVCAAERHASRLALSRLHSLFLSRLHVRRGSAPSRLQIALPKQTPNSQQIAQKKLQSK